MGLLVRVINGPFAFPISHRIRAREKERKRASNQFYYVKGGKISREIFFNDAIRLVFRSFFD